MAPCPRCGQAMTPGYLGTKNFPAGLQWYLGVSNFGVVPGEPVATIRKLQMEFVAGERCPGCRVMILAY